VGNVPTEVVLATLKELGAVTPRIGEMEELLRKSEEIGIRFGR
jgi:hypothetical protein